MTSQAQVLANRRNAKKSTGPRTTTGKLAVSRNALTHGLSTRRDVIPTESQADFDLYRRRMLDELSPTGPTESMLAERIVSLSWRLKRTDRIQNQTITALHAQATAPDPLAHLTRSHIPDPETSLGRTAIKDFSNDRVLERLLMYERRIENSLYKTTLELQRLTLIRQITPNQTP